MKHPEPYDGKADLDVFDGWVHSITNYAEVMKVRETTMIRMMSEYVTGTARIFYLKNVAGRAHKWSFATIFLALFNYCFPKDFIKKLCIKWNNMTIGK